MSCGLSWNPACVGVWPAGVREDPPCLTFGGARRQAYNHGKSKMKLEA